jgi:hypothetical protein
MQHRGVAKTLRRRKYMYFPCAFLAISMGKKLTFLNLHTKFPGDVVEHFGIKDVGAG